MTLHYDGIWEARMIYSTTPTGHVTMTHRMALDVHPFADYAPGTEFTDINIVLRDAAVEKLFDHIDAFQLLVEPLYPATTSFARWELWKIPEGTYDATFISAYEVGHVGSNAAASRPAGQVTLTFRSLAGNSGRLQLMESSEPSDSRVIPPYPGDYADLADYVIAANTPFEARDNSYFFANIALNMGQNEKLFRKRFRS